MTQGLLLMVAMFAALSASMPAGAQDTAQAVRQAPIPSSGVVDGLTVYHDLAFGVGKDDVRAYEKAAFYKEEGDSLYFLYKPDFFRRLIRYDFGDDKLVRIHHSIVEFHFPNAGRVVETYYDVLEELRGLYGEPAATDLFWKDKRYEKYPDYWGRALYSRDLRMVTRWTLPDAAITLECYHDGRYYQLHYTIESASVSVQPPPRNAIDLPVAPVQP